MVTALLEQNLEEMDSLDADAIGSTIGVAQAIGELRKALDGLDAHLDAREFERASNIGYRDVTSAFVFLQRTLGGLQSADHASSAFITRMAEQLQCTHEDIASDVKSRMQCYQPKSVENGAAWKRENADAMAQSNEWVDENGLPLSEHRSF